MIGAAFSYGVKRAVNSSGAGFGETPASAAAAETSHPATQGLVTAFSVYIDVAVCICSGLMAIVTDCFNVMGPDGSTYLHIGEGSAKMAEPRPPPTRPASCGSRRVPTPPCPSAASW